MKNWPVYVTSEVLPKTCSRCSVEKTTLDFYVHKSRGQDRYSAQCKACESETAIAWKKANPYKARMTDNRYRERHLLLKRLRSYGITEGVYREMVERQCGLCPICLRSIDEQTSHIDHDHDTGEVRGVLCGSCNIGLGNFAEDPMRLIRAARYVVVTTHEERVAQ